MLGFLAVVGMEQVGGIDGDGLRGEIDRKFFAGFGSWRASGPTDDIQDLGSELASRADRSNAGIEVGSLHDSPVKHTLLTSEMERQLRNLSTPHHLDNPVLPSLSCRYRVAVRDRNRLVQARH